MYMFSKTPMSRPLYGITLKCRYHNEIHLCQAEAKTRLQGFEGATSISSNAYFGRPEEEQQEEYGDLESAAKDFIRRFGITAGDDLDNITAVVGEQATKLQGAIRAYLRS